MAHKSRTFAVRARGPIACWTRPEMKVERVSYEVMTPSAARGLLEAVLWKPALVWRVEEISVLSPIRWCSFRRNEVNSRASARMGPYFADEDRAQRNTVALANVDYVIRAHLELSEKKGSEDNIPKFEEMFERRLAKGQHFHAPYLGCREFAADVEVAPPTFSTIEPGVRRPLGLVFYDFDFRSSPPRSLFFDAVLEAGRLRVPPVGEVLQANGVGP